MSDSKSQLSLDIVPRCPYAADRFLLHAGIAGILREILTQVQNSAFSVSYIEGSKRSGKTHFCVKLDDELSRLGFNVSLFGNDFGLSHEDALELLPSNDANKYVIIIDDADIFFKKFPVDNSGGFVSWLEAWRVAKGNIIFISNTAMDDLKVDEHVTSRLKPGAGYVISNPKENELTTLLRLIALQRGLSITDRQIEFVKKRVERDICSIESFVDELLSQAYEKGSVQQAVVRDSIESIRK